MRPLEGQRIVVAGLGTSGFAAARELHRLGAIVRVTESSTNNEIQRRAAMLAAEGVEVETGGHDPAHLDEADLVVMSPGIPLRSEIVAAAHRKGIEVIGEVEMAYRLAHCDFLAVTGTNGKTTTTSVLAAMLAEAGVPSVAAGNIGLPVMEAVAAIGAGGAIALEVSSFQLATIDRFRPVVAVMLNIAEDHTDWHGSYEAYAAAKARISENQGPDDVFVANLDDPHVAAVADRVAARVVGYSTRMIPERGIGVDGRHVVASGRPLLALDDIPLHGVAGLEDCIAAIAAALEYGVDERAIVRAVKEFRPLHHRLEVVAELDDVMFIDDSKATNPHATLAAVRGLNDVVLIAGGRSKGIDLSSLARTVPPVRAVVAIGEAAPEIERVFSGLVEVESVASMPDAVRTAFRKSAGKGSVLLSPGCASLDMFSGYAARGDAFRRAVRGLIDENGRRWGRGEP